MTARYLFPFLILCILTDKSEFLSVSSDLSLSTSDLEEYIQDSSNHPVCVLLKTDNDEISLLEKEVHTSWTQAGLREGNSKWTLARYLFSSQENPEVILKPATLPQLRCYIEPKQWHDYNRTNILSLQLWLHQLIHDQKTTIPRVTETDVDYYIKSYAVTLLVFTESRNHLELQYLAGETCQVIEGCYVALIDSNSQTSSLLMKKYKVKNIPGIAVVQKTDKHGFNEMRYFTGHELTVRRLQTYILAVAIPVDHLKTENFKEKVLKVYERKKYVAYIVGFYAYWAEGTSSFLKQFTVAAEDFSEADLNIRLGLVDITQDGAVVQRYVNSKFAENVPFVLLFQQDGSAVNQTLLETDSHSSSYSIYIACLLAGFHLIDRMGEEFIYQPYGYSDPHHVCDRKEDPWIGKTCSLYYNNLTDYSLLPKRISSSKKLHITKEKKLTTIHGMTRLSETNWYGMVEKSLMKSNIGFSVKQGDNSVNMVAFIKVNCGSCSRHMSTFQTLKSNVQALGSALYIVNCTSDSNICEQHKISGFPTITALRTVVDQSSSHCFTHHVPDVRLDYHGPIQVNSVMEWFSEVSMEPVIEMKFLQLPKMTEDVRLVGVVIPVDSSYLPFVPAYRKGYYYSELCYEAVCRRLTGLVSCYSVYSRDIPPSEYSTHKHSHFVLAELRLERRDGISADIMRITQPLYTTIQQESPQLQRMHQPHKYNLGSQQTCEEDHGMCGDFITSYVRDHMRLPVTHLTSAIFHTSNNPYKENRLPVVVALVESKHLENNSSFLHMLERIGYEFYDTMMIVTLDVNVFPAWAGQFVPLGYRNDFHGREEEGDLYTYPRICVVHWSDHTRAAFYPPVTYSEQENFTINMTNLSQFLSQYLKNPSNFMIKTEHF